jgi:hypothetical protein
MNQQEVVSALKADSIVRPFLERVISQAELTHPEEGPKQYAVTGIDVFLTIAAYSLFRWAKEHFDAKKDAARARAVAEHSSLIAELVKAGFPATEAREIVMSLMKEVGSRNENDPVLLAVQRMTQGNH